MDYMNAGRLDRVSRVGLACRLGDVDMLKELLMMGADCSVRDNRGWYPLHEAAFSGHHLCLKAMLESPNAVDIDPNVQSHDGSTPLLLACQRCCLKSVETLCQFGADTNLATLDHMTPLIAVAEKRESEVVPIIKVLLKYGADIQKKYFNGWSSLHYAAASGNQDAVSLLLENEASPSCVDSEGITPVFLSVQYGWINCFTALIRAADEPVPSLVNRQSTDAVSCTYVAAQEGYDAILRQLLAYGADCNIPTQDGFLPIIAAIKSGYSRCLTLLMQSTDRTLVDSMCEDPVFVAVESRSNDCLKILIENGYNVNRIKAGDNLRFPTPIYRYLQPLLAKVNCTAMARAVVITSPDLCETLLQGGATPCFSDETTFSPFLLAILKRKYPDILQAFLKHGMDVNCTTVHSLCRAPDAMLIAIHPVYKQQLHELLKAGLDPMLKYWCGCHPPDHVTDGYTFLEEIVGLLNGQEMESLLRLLVSYAKTIPYCCELWRNVWDQCGMTDVASNPKRLKDLSRLEIRSCIGSGELYKNVWYHNLPLPQFLSRFLSFPAADPSCIHNLYRDQ